MRGLYGETDSESGLIGVAISTAERPWPFQGVFLAGPACIRARLSERYSQAGHREVPIIALVTAVLLTAIFARSQRYCVGAQARPISGHMPSALHTGNARRRHASRWRSRILRRGQRLVAVQFGVNAVSLGVLVLENDDLTRRVERGLLIEQLAGSGGGPQLVPGVPPEPATRAHRGDQLRGIETAEERLRDAENLGGVAHALRRKVLVVDVLFCAGLVRCA